MFFSLTAAPILYRGVGLMDPFSKILKLIKTKRSLDRLFGEICIFIEFIICVSYSFQ